MAQVILKNSKDVKPDTEENIQVLRFNYFYTYVMLFECMISLYKPIYKKLTGMKDLRVKEMISFFNNKYPYMTLNLDYDLRNDASHMLFVKRADYTNDKLKQISIDLILQLIALFYSLIDVYIGIVENSVKISDSYKK